MNDNYPQTHLSQSDRFVIERMLMASKSFKQIAEKLSRHPSTISREIRKNRNFILVHTTIGNDCSYSGSCTFKNLCDEDGCSRRCAFCKTNICREFCNEYLPVHCTKLDKKPYVCNTCKSRSSCKHNHAYYNAQVANATYLRNLSNSRSGIHASSKKLHELDQLVTPLLKKGQSLGHIFANHADEIYYSRKTIYNYVEARAFTARNIDLPRKVRYKRRKKLNINSKIQYKYRLGRTYQDFTTYKELNPDIPVVEIDTVKGTREKGNVLLTMIFCNYNFMLIFIMPAASQKCVLEVFDRLTNILGLKTFNKLFPLILTDNGCEFKDVDALEYTKNGVQRTKMFYCDPNASWQKPHIEKNHEFIRYVIPKGKSFDSYTQKDMTLLANHINSISRDSLGGKCPYELAETFLNKKLVDSLDLELIPYDDVTMKPNLLKN